MQDTLKISDQKDLLTSAEEMFLEVPAQLLDNINEKHPEFWAYPEAPERMFENLVDFIKATAISQLVLARARLLANNHYPHCPNDQERFALGVVAFGSCGFDLSEPQLFALAMLVASQLGFIETKNAILLACVVVKMSKEASK